MFNGIFLRYPSFTLWNSGLEVQTHAFFTSLDRGEQFPRSVRFIPGKGTLCQSDRRLLGVLEPVWIT